MHLPENNPFKMFSNKLFPKDEIVALHDFSFEQAKISQIEARNLDGISILHRYTKHSERNMIGKDTVNTFQNLLNRIE